MRYSLDIAQLHISSAEKTQVAQINKFAGAMMQTEVKTYLCDLKMFFKHPGVL